MFYTLLEAHHISSAQGLHLPSFQNEFTHFLQGHNILLSTVELLKAKAKKPFTPCKYVLVCLCESFRLNTI
jgi:hypothetical protein